MEDVKIPKNVYIRLNRVCNLDCVFCLAKKAAPGFSLEMMKNVLDTLSAEGVIKAKLTGGEPLLHPEFFGIMQYCFDLKMDVVVYSNLCIASEIIDRLVQYPIKVVTSIHGDKTFHNKVTGRDCYNTTYKNILKLTAKKIPVDVHMVIMKENYTLAENVIKDAIKAGVKKVTFQTLIPREKGAEFFKCAEDEENIQKILESLFSLQEKYRSNIEISFSNLYKKECFVLETDGVIYSERGRDSFPLKKVI